MGSLTPDFSNGWWDMSKWVANTFPFGSKIAPYLSPYLSTQAALEKATITLVLAAKGVKVVAAPLYFLFPHMKKYLPYKATEAYIHGLAYLITKPLNFLSSPLRDAVSAYKNTPVHAVTSALVRGMASVITAPVRALVKFAFPVEGKSGLGFGRRATRFVMGPFVWPVLATHRYFNRKIQQVGGIMKSSDYQAPVYDRTLWGDVKYVASHLPSVLGQGVRNLANTPATVFTLGGAIGGGGFVLGKIAPHVFHALTYVPALGEWPIVGGAISGLASVAISSIPAAMIGLMVAAASKYTYRNFAELLGDNDPGRTKAAISQPIASSEHDAPKATQPPSSPVVLANAGLGFTPGARLVVEGKPRERKHHALKSSDPRDNIMAHMTGRHRHLRA